MHSFICPICKGSLFLENSSYKCTSNHCFDVSRYGYVNLLHSKNSSNHGDDKVMVKARKDFLEKGYYRPLLDELVKGVLSIATNGDMIIDSGCGEGWYSSEIYNAVCGNGIKSDMYAVDISKEALVYAGKRSRKIYFAVASAYNLPFTDACCDILISLFAPYAREEFLRILKTGGFFITAFPLENHLYGLKSAIYSNPYRNEVADYALEGFEIVDSRKIHKKIILEDCLDIQNLFKMTPYFYKTSAEDQKKLFLLEKLETEIEFAYVLYKKI